MRVVEVGQYFVTKDTGSLRQLSGLSRIHFASRWSSFTGKRMDSRKHENWTCIGSHDQFSTLQIWNWNPNLVCESRQFSILGQIFLWNDQICGRFNARQHRNSCGSTRRASITNKHEGCCSQIKRQKQNHNREYLLVQQQPYQYMKEDGLTLNHQNKILLHTIFRRKWSIFFDKIKRLQREDDGAIEFYKIKFYLRNHHSQIQVWSWWSLESLFGCRRRFEKKISVLFW